MQELFPRVSCVGTLDISDNGERQTHTHTHTHRMDLDSRHAAGFESVSTSSGHVQYFIPSATLQSRRRESVTPLFKLKGNATDFQFLHVKFSHLTPR